MPPVKKMAVVQQVHRRIAASRTSIKQAVANPAQASEPTIQTPKPTPQQPWVRRGWPGARISAQPARAILTEPDPRSAIEHPQTASWRKSTPLQL
jgi:hypothetical protein